MCAIHQHTFRLRCSRATKNPRTSFSYTAGRHTCYLLSSRLFLPAFSPLCLSSSVCRSTRSLISHDISSPKQLKAAAWLSYPTPSSCSHLRMRVMAVPRGASHQPAARKSCRGSALLNRRKHSGALKRKLHRCQEMCKHEVLCYFLRLIKSVLIL